MYSVYQHWDPLKVCVVGRSYPPEFYSWITKADVRNLFERIAIETEEDYQAIIKKLESFGVEVLRPELPKINFINGRYVKPPMSPRDYTVMIGTTMYQNYSGYSFGHFYWNAKQSGWPDCHTEEDFLNLPQSILQIALPLWIEYKKNLDTHNCFDHIWQRLENQGNKIKSWTHTVLNGAMTARIGRDLYIGTENYDQDPSDVRTMMDREFSEYRTHVVNTGGHSDGTYCPVAPGLIISLQDVPTYAESYPGWEVVYLPGQSWESVGGFLKMKKVNDGRWWIPGFEDNQNVVDTVESWMSHWVGYVEETVFDVNMLIVNPKNVIVFNYNKTVFDALERYGITPHIVTFRHRYFWDGGIHCITSDLHRLGTIQDYFPGRSNSDIPVR